MYVTGILLAFYQNCANTERASKTPTGRDRVNLRNGEKTLARHNRRNWRKNHVVIHLHARHLWAKTVISSLTEIVYCLLTKLEHYFVVFIKVIVT